MTLSYADDSGYSSLIQKQRQLNLRCKDVNKKSPAPSNSATMNISQKRHFIRTGAFIVYIVECIDGTYYTGYTRNIVARLKLHNSGRGSKYVRSKRPVKLVYFKKYRYYKLAVNEERRIKGLSRKAKEMLVQSHKIRILL